MAVQSRKSYITRLIDSDLLATITRVGRYRPLSWNVAIETLPDNIFVEIFVSYLERGEDNDEWCVLVHVCLMRSRCSVLEDRLPPRTDAICPPDLILGHPAEFRGDGGYLDASWPRQILPLNITLLQNRPFQVDVFQSPRCPGAGQSAFTVPTNMTLGCGWLQLKVLYDSEGTSVSASGAGLQLLIAPPQHRTFLCFHSMYKGRVNAQAQSEPINLSQRTRYSWIFASFSAAKSLSLESTIHNGSTSWDPTLVGKPSVPQDGSQGRARYTGDLGESAENLSDHERLHAAYRGEGVGGKNRV